MADSWARFPKVVLTAAEMSEAHAVLRARQEFDRDTFVVDRAVSDLANDPDAMAAEFAVAKWLGVEPDRSTDQPAGGTDLVSPRGTTIDVKYRPLYYSNAGTTRVSRFDIFIHAGKRLNEWGTLLPVTSDVFLQVMGAPPNFMLVGYVWWDIARLCWDDSCPEPCYHVPREALCDVRELL